MKKILFTLFIALSFFPGIVGAHGEEMMPFDSLGGVGGMWFWAGGLIHLIWLTVGILAIVWLWKQISKK
ncbi:MAG: hypothetical protein COU71_02335 [Parcubacteria group bacterium CG10_big_fil_rev_8_21_14_0_10_38_31]|nr:MAG: hypothetical protein COU71_02335 [Parcubacteria group bacterium CG10_big_fil_rev_8_21_14_0_10_38_31]